MFPGDTTLERLRKQVAGELRSVLGKLATSEHAQGKYLFEGDWRTPEQIAQLYRELRLKDRRIFFEVLLLMGVLAGGTLLVIVMLYSACCRT